MTHLEIELDQLKKAVLEMMNLANSQIKKAKTAFLERDVELAREIIHTEKRINAMELSIDRDCENIFALFNPVATNLRFVISMLKMNSDIERIADYADGLADYVVDIDQDIPSEALEKTKVGEMFDITILMLNDVITALENEDTTLARKVFAKDAELNTINSNASRIIREFIIQSPESTRPLLFLFSAIRKIERIGDHIKNLAEDTIFYVEAEILKHSKNKDA